MKGALTQWSGPWAAGAASVLVAAALFFGGGSSDTSLFWLGSAAVLAAAALVVGALLGVVPRPRLDRWGTAFVALFAGFVLWLGLSVLWSVEPDRSWDYFNRGLAYLGLLVLAVFAGALVPRAPRAAAAVLAVLLAGVLLWALAGKVIPALFPDGARRARLRSPVGYWNALALLGAAALPLALWVLARARARARVGAVLLVYVAAVAILLTYSRSGVLLAALGVAAWIALADRRLAALVAVAIGGGVGGAVAAIGFQLAGVADDGQPNSARVRDGAIFGVALLIGAAVVVALALAAERYEKRVTRERERFLLRQSLAGAGFVAALVLLVLVIRAGGPVDWLDARLDEFKNPTTAQISNQPGRVLSTSSNNRWTWWQEAAGTFADHPVAGTGAGSFQVAHRRLRESGLDVREPHSLPLQLLSETGLVGFLLAFGAACAAVLAAVRALRHLRPDDALAGRALGLVAALWLVHVLVDIDWDFVAVTAPALCAVGVLVGSGVPAGLGRRSPLWAAGVAVLALGSLYSLAAPWLADRRVDAAYASLGEALNARGVAARDALIEAADSARSAQALNPVSIEPLLAGGAIAEARGDNNAARTLFLRATEVQPENRDAWYELGRFELIVQDDARSAYTHFNRMYTLDRFGPGTELLDETRCRLDPKPSCPPVFRPGARPASKSS